MDGRYFVIKESCKTITAGGQVFIPSRVRLQCYQVPNHFKQLRWMRFCWWSGGREDFFVANITTSKTWKLALCCTLTDSSRVFWPHCSSHLSVNFIRAGSLTEHRRWNQGTTLFMAPASPSFCAATESLRRLSKSPRATWKPTGSIHLWGQTMPISTPPLHGGSSKLNCAQSQTCSVLELIWHKAL